MMLTTTVENLAKGLCVSQKLISDELAKDLSWTLNFVIRPCICVPGFICNLITIVIIIRQGVRKCSNILILALAVADALFLLGGFNLPHLIYMTEPSGFTFTPNVNAIMHSLFTIFRLFEKAGVQISLTLPVFITTERMFAVFFPLKFYMIVTPIRVLVAVACLYSVWILMDLYSLLFLYDTIQTEKDGVQVSVLRYNDHYYVLVNSGIFYIIDQVVNNLSGLVPIILVCLGCIVIGVKVKLATMKRNTMASGGGKNHRNMKATSRTTKTLLVICCLFVVFNGYAFINAFFMKIYDDCVTMKMVLLNIQDCVLSVNSACNFAVYVAMNKHFRVTVKKWFAL